MTIFEKIESFATELEREAYEVGAGLKSEANFSEIFDRADSLISQDTVNELREAEIGHDERAECLSFLLCMIIDKSLKNVTDEIVTMELTSEVSIGSESVPYRQLPVMIANEPNHKKRAELDLLRLDVLKTKLNDLSRLIIEQTHDMAKSFGYKSYREYFESIEGMKLDPLREETQRFLTSTEKFYKNELEHYSKRLLGLEISELAQYDTMHMRRADAFDALFPKEKMLSSTWATMNNMGIEAEKHPHVTLDIESRPSKSFRAFCCPVRVPYEVYLVIQPQGGVEDYASFLHELGHTLHYAHTDASLPISARLFGDNSVTEAHAATLERLIYNPKWLMRRLGVAEPGEYLRYMRFFELYMIRRYCAKLHYEMELHGGEKNVEECAAIYAKTLTDATLIRYFPECWLQDLDSHFYCARYLRSWMLENQITSYLSDNFGDDWFDKPEAGKALTKMWSQGQKHRAEVMSASLGYEKLSFDTLIKQYGGR